MMGRPKKAIKTTNEGAMDTKAFADKIRAEAYAEFTKMEEPGRERERFEHYKRMVRSGDSGNISGVIFHALTNRDNRADIALREYIAELIDAGRDDELNVQLRFYLVQYLVHPLVRPLGSFVRV